MIYAVDYDGTLCEEVEHGLGEMNTSLIQRLISQKEKGDQIILWTCREGDRLNEAICRCKNEGLDFDAVNDNVLSIKKWGLNPRKVFAHYYIDDKSVDNLKYGIPFLGGGDN